MGDSISWASRGEFTESQETSLPTRALPVAEDVEVLRVAKNRRIKIYQSNEEDSFSFMLIVLLDRSGRDQLFSFLTIPAQFIANHESRFYPVKI